MEREDQIRDFLNTVLLPGTNTSLGAYALTPVFKDQQIQLMIEVPLQYASLVPLLLKKVEEELALVFPGYQILCGFTIQKPEKAPKPIHLEEVKHIICVASGKGGVGKSTTALNLAIALQQLGYQVGLLDADIYGPSLPHMLNLHGSPPLTPDKKMIPLNAYGMQVLSIGLLVPPDQAIIWRGPMVQGAFLQLLKQAQWKADILIIDMPPGTGDVPLTLCQQIHLDGAVIVSTPQDVALIDAKRAIHMFQKAGISLLGMVENMSFFECPACHHHTAIFHEGGAKKASQMLGIPFLGALPIDLSIRQGGDKGQPFQAQAPTSTIGLIYQHMAKKIAQQLDLPPSS